MKRIKHIYSWSTIAGEVESHRIIHQRFGSLVRESGISGEVIRESELDSLTARYFTTPLGAVEAFIHKATHAIANGPATSSGAWKEALDVALSAREKLQKKGKRT